MASTGRVDDIVFNPAVYIEKHMKRLKPEEQEDLSSSSPRDMSLFDYF